MLFRLDDQGVLASEYHQFGEFGLWPRSDNQPLLQNNVNTTTRIKHVDPYGNPTKDTSVSQQEMENVFLHVHFAKLGF